MYISASSFAFPYGETGSVGVLSVIGNDVGAPYTAHELLYTKTGTP
jgi:hypothetical protein